MSITLNAPAAATRAPTSGLFDLLFQVLFSPAQAVHKVLARRRRMGLALLLLVGVQTGLWMAYFHGVDFEWLRSYLTESTLQRHPQIDPGQLRQGMAAMTPGGMVLSSVFTTVMGVLMLSVLRTGIYNVVGKFVSDKEIPFLSWLALVLWSTLPQVLGALGSLVYLGVADISHLTPGQLSLSSLNALVLHLPAGHNWANWAGTVDLLQLWSIGICAAGFQQLAKKGWLQSWLLAAVPYVLYFGAWALLNLR